MQQHRIEAQLFRQAAGMLPTGSAIGHQHTAANVLAAVQGHATDRIGHALDG